MQKKYSVYKHTNKINSKVYIGITCQKVNERWGKNGSGYISSPHFYSSIQYYGWNNFEHEILFENLTKEQACNKEKELIALYNSNDSNFGYNCTSGGECFEMNDIAKEKKSKAMKGNKNSCGVVFTEERKRNISNALKGKKFSAERKQKLSQAKKGKSHKRISDEGIEHLRNSEYHLAKRRKVYCFETETVYDSIHDCAKAIGYKDCATSICACCRGRNKQFKGFHFCYYDDLINKKD